MNIRHICFFGILCAQTSVAAESLDSIVSRINKRIESEHLPLAKLNKTALKDWFNDYLPFGMVKEMRAPLLKGLQSDTLIDSYSIDIDLRENIPVPGLKPLVVFMGKDLRMPVIEGENFSFYRDFAELACQPSTTCSEEYRGEFPSDEGTAFPSNTSIVITEAKAPGNCLANVDCLPDILDIKVEIEQANIESLVNYFGHGFDKTTIRARLIEELGNASKK